MVSDSIINFVTKKGYLFCIDVSWSMCTSNKSLLIYIYSTNYNRWLVEIYRNECTGWLDGVTACWHFHSDNVDAPMRWCADAPIIIYVMPTYQHDDVSTELNVYKGSPYRCWYDDADMPCRGHNLLLMMDIAMATCRQADLEENMKWSSNMSRPTRQNVKGCLTRIRKVIYLLCISI